MMRYIYTGQVRALLRSLSMQRALRLHAKR